jgi:hypothetical protein
VSLPDSGALGFARTVRQDMMLLSWRRPFSINLAGNGGTEMSAPALSSSDDHSDSDRSYGRLKFVREKGQNDSSPSYQEATGAPVEVNSPLGYFVGPATIIFLNVSQMIGTGVYSTRKLPTYLEGRGRNGIPH